MPDNVTYQTTVATPPNATVVRTKDRSGIESQIIGLDTNPGGSAEQLMSSPDGNLPARIKDLDMSIRVLIAALVSSPSLDAFDRRQVFLNGGVTSISALPTLALLTTITNPVNQTTPGGSQLFQNFQPISQVAWATSVRNRIS